ncbi:MAG: GNAT family N-acetyltransferase [Clostridia bacterium]|nr:GNAT family N-acetyltransferase [Clostridia bacterium]
MEISIRKASSKDYETINGMFMKIHEYHMDNLTNLEPIDKYCTKEDYNKELEEGVFFIAEENSRAVGFVGATLKEDNNVKVPTVSGIYVNEDERRKGISKLLMSELINYSNKNFMGEGFSNTIEVDLHGFDTNAQALYEELGFEA